MKYLLLFLITTTSFASNFDRAGVTVAAFSDEYLFAVDGARFWRIGDSKFFFGVGPRLTSHWSSDQKFETAPAKLTRGTSGPLAMFRSRKEENIDDLRVGQSQITTLNIAIHLLYQLSDRWSAGFNIDAIGVSHGSGRRARYLPLQDQSSFPETVEAKPTSFNLLQGDDNDRGSLNSEFYLHRKYVDGWGVKFGLTHAFTEYTTAQKLRNGNDRFRRKNYLANLGITKDF